MDNVIASIQAKNGLQISNEVSKLKDDNEALKAALDASDDPCFELKTSPKFRMKKDKWCIFINQRKNKDSIKGKRINSRCFLNKKSA